MSKEIEDPTDEFQQFDFPAHVFNFHSEGRDWLSPSEDPISNLPPLESYIYSDVVWLICHWLQFNTERPLILRILISIGSIFYKRLKMWILIELITNQRSSNDLFGEPVGLINIFCIIHVWNISIKMWTIDVSVSVCLSDGIFIESLLFWAILTMQSQCYTLSP